MDIARIKLMVMNNHRTALSEGLEERLLNDRLTERDIAFLQRSFASLEDLEKNMVVTIDSDNNLRVETKDQYDTRKYTAALDILNNGFEPPDKRR
jgi:hypothetical protein